VTQFRIAEVVRETGVRRGTLRHWVKMGLLPPPPRRGRGTKYDEAFITRVRAARALREQGHRLREVRRRLAKATALDLSVLASKAATPGGPVALPSPPVVPITYPAERWEKIVLLPGLEVHVGGSNALLRRIAQEIYTHYGSSIVAAPEPPADEPRPRRKTAAPA